MTRTLIKNLYIVSIIVAISLLGLLGLWSYVRYYEAKKDWEEKKITYAKAKAQIVEINNSIEKFQKEKVEFESYLFREQDIPAFLEGISDFAEQAKVSVVDMKTAKFTAVQSPKSKAEEIKQGRGVTRKTDENKQLTIDQMLTLAAMPITIKVEGKYEDFVTFLDKLEGFKQLLTISNVEIESGRSYPILQCDFTLKIYSFKTLEELAKT